MMVKGAKIMFCIPSHVLSFIIVVILLAVIIPVLLGFYGMNFS
ncbi:hypothetical protein SAMN04487970_101589 [Paenibacillus tianmuensis]|uniref:Uncharacterized protein n=1 Tax=Paenibacillus tianmuensis TaxID=624147 RepID=A0A1G4RH49_9BACL|nr:hypothetical protein SAMN04487970_101589 [Paenibacillus tianmuensis]